MQTTPHPHVRHSPGARDASLLVDQVHRTQEDLAQFVRALAHDIRANLMLMESSLRRVRRALGASEDVDHLEACLCQSQRLLDDMAELGRSGSIRVNPGRVALQAVIDEVLYEQRELLDRRNVEVAIQRPLPVLWCNEDRLKQVVVNLVRNAVLHGCDPRHPRIAISPVDGGMSVGMDGTPLSGFQIHDNGPGIELRWREQMFLAGFRLPGSKSEGSGLGLAIVRRIVNLYGGEVYVDPDCPQGTSFVVRLPVAPNEAPASASDAAEGRSDQKAARHGGHSPRPHAPLQGLTQRPDGR